MRVGLSPLLLIRVVELLLVIALAAVLANMAWPYFTSSATGDLSTSRAAAQAPEKSLDADAGQQASAMLKSLFGTVDADNEKPQLDAGAVRETKLNLVLKGILADSGSGNKLALIDQGNGREIIARVGDKISDAKIVHIGARRILLRRNGVNEFLTLNAKQQPLKITDQPEPAPRTGRRNAAREDGAGSPRLVAKETLARDLGNLPMLLSQAKTIPYLHNGENAGFRLVQIAQGSVFSDLGLQRNDVIRSVNGHPVRSAGEALLAYRKLKTASSLQVDILRGERRMTLEYSIR